jgi:hypothetical protein
MMRKEQPLLSHTGIKEPRFSCSILGDPFVLLPRSLYVLTMALQAAHQIPKINAVQKHEQTQWSTHAFIALRTAHWH